MVSLLIDTSEIFRVRWFAEMQEKKIALQTGNYLKVNRNLNVRSALIIIRLNHQSAYRAFM
jgi:DNA-binding protein